MDCLSILNESEQNFQALQLAYQLSKLVTTDNGALNFSGAGSNSTGSANSPEDSNPRRQSLNTTECVAVPTSEHVAEIVGRQGCKIKALRAKTNTYIKTPSRGELPVFSVTGRQEDVEVAKGEILSAAEHFTQIRASRRHTQGGAPAPGQVTEHVAVPYKVIGLVVGPKGATIKRIQQQTHTYIVTPSRDMAPAFSITGLPENVATAKREIQTYIAVRTGDAQLAQHEDAGEELTDDFCLNGLDMSFSGDALGGGTTVDHSCSIGGGSAWPPCTGAPMYTQLQTPGQAMWGMQSPMFQLPTVFTPGSLFSSVTDDRGGRGLEDRRWSSGLSSHLSSPDAAVDGTGLHGRSRSFDHSYTDATAVESVSGSAHVPARRVSSAPSSGPPLCHICQHAPSGSMLVPCGHKQFCYVCGMRLFQMPQPVCPICQVSIAGVKAYGAPSRRL